MQLTALVAPVVTVRRGPGGVTVRADERGRFTGDTGLVVGHCERAWGRENGKQGRGVSRISRVYDTLPSKLSTVRKPSEQVD